MFLPKTRYGAIALSALFLGACGADSTSSDNVPPNPDIATSGTFYQYVMSNMMLPQNDSQYAGDVDGNGTTDGQMNALITFLEGEFSHDPHGDLTREIQQGNLVMLNSMRADNLANDDTVSWQIYRGLDNPNPKLDGTDTFNLRPDTETDDVIVGEINNGRFVGQRSPDIRFHFHFADSVQVVNLYGATLNGPVTANNCGTLNDPVTMTGAIRRTDIDAFVDQLDGLINTIAARENCAPATVPLLGDVCRCSGAGGGGLDLALGTALTTVDQNGDCRANRAEVEGYLGSRLDPDTDMFDGNTYAPGQDGIPDSLGFGVGFECVKASFAE